MAVQCCIPIHLGLAQMNNAVTITTIVLAIVPVYGIVRITTLTKLVIYLVWYKRL